MIESAAELEFRTLQLPQGPFVVLWEQPAGDRTLLALLPQSEAQGYLDTVQDGQVPACQPQLVEERGGALHPVPEDEAARSLLSWIAGHLGN